MSTELMTPPIVPEQLAARLKVVADPTRLRIFTLLMSGVQCNCELGDALGLAPNLISHHISVLRHAGLVHAERDPNDARWIYYSIDRLALRDLHTALVSFFDPATIQDRQPACGPSGIV
jgi:ArsR family transcriptional regulator